MLVNANISFEWNHLDLRKMIVAYILGVHDRNNRKEKAHNQSHSFVDEWKQHNAKLSRVLAKREL
jgi:hypothetical protein